MNTNKLFKISIMAFVILAVITMSSSVFAFSNSDLITYLTTTHNVNGEDYTLPDNQKAQVTDYLTRKPVTDEVATAIRNDIEEAISKVNATGARCVAEMDPKVKSQVAGLLISAGDKAGVDITIYTESKTMVITERETGKELSRGSYSSYTNLPDKTSTSQANSGKLVYTGNTNLFPIMQFLIIVAISTILVLKRKKD